MIAVLVVASGGGAGSSASAVPTVTLSAMTVPTAALNPAPTNPQVDLVGEACPAVGWCALAGGYRDSAGNPEGLLETFSAGFVDAVTAPSGGLTPPAAVDPETSIDDVSCPAAGWCMAAGSYDDAAGEFQGLFETLTGGIWTPTSLLSTGLRPPADPADFSGAGPVSCPAVGSCVAQAFYTDSSGVAEAVYETLSGGTWTATAAPAPPASAASRAAALAAAPAPRVLLPIEGCPIVGKCFSCPTAGSCVEVESTTDLFAISSEIETLANGTWSAIAAPTAGLNPPAATGSRSGVLLSGVSCPAAGSCVASGVYDTSSSSLPLVEVLADGTWTAANLPTAGLDPPAAQFLGPSTVSCPVTGWCVVQGDYAGFSGFDRGYFETLANGSWTVANAPVSGLGLDIDTSISSLLDLSCASVGSCVAVGTASPFSGPALLPMFEVLAGGTWAATPASSAGLDPPAKPDTTSVFGVSCPSAEWCLADGAYVDTAGDDQGLTETVAIAPPEETTTTVFGPGSGTSASTTAHPVPSAVPTEGTVAPEGNLALTGEQAGVPLDAGVALIVLALAARHLRRRVQDGEGRVT